IYIIFITLIWEFAYNLNSNFLIKPITKSPLFYTQDNLTERKRGFNQLDKYLRQEVLPQELKLKRPQKLSDILQRAAVFLAENETIYFFDDSSSWFAHHWYFRKYSNFYGLPMLPFYQQAETLDTPNPVAYFNNLGVHNFYFIHAVHQSVLDPSKIDSVTRKTANSFASMLDQKKADVKEIKNYYNQVVFRVYKFYLD
ncbi:MAG: hypothetical protein ABIJ91_00055, partial [Candidatus Kuenenbacteria bacterium]